MGTACSLHGCLYPVQHHIRVELVLGAQLGQDPQRPGRQGRQGCGGCAGQDKRRPEYGATATSACCQLISRDPGSRHQRVAVDAAFFARLRKLLRIVIPGWRTKESLMLGLHTIFLVLRTMLSLYVADLDGR